MSVAQHETPRAAEKGADGTNSSQNAMFCRSKCQSVSLRATIETPRRARASIRTLSVNQSFLRALTSSYVTNVGVSKQHRSEPLWPLGDVTYGRHRGLKSIVLAYARSLTSSRPASRMVLLTRQVRRGRRKLFAVSVSQYVPCTSSGDPASPRTTRTAKEGFQLRRVISIARLGGETIGPSSGAGVSSGICVRNLANELDRRAKDCNTTSCRYLSNS